MISSTKTRLLLKFLTVVLVGTSQAAAQKGSIAGFIYDPHDAVIVGARVNLYAASSANKLPIKRTITDARGHYQFQGISPGGYRLIAEAPQFTPVSHDVVVAEGAENQANLQFLSVASHQRVTVNSSVPDVMSPDPAERTFPHSELLEANPGRPGAPVSIPGLPIETASGGIKAPQYFAPGVAGDHGEPIAQFFQVGNFLFPNNLPANAHGNGYSDPNFLISNGIGSVQADSGAFNVREGNHSVNLAVSYGLWQRLEPFVQLTGDYRDIDLISGWSPRNLGTNAWLAAEISFGNGLLARLEHRQQYKLNGYRVFKSGHHEIALLGFGYYGFSFVSGLIPIAVPVPSDTIDSRQQDRTHNTLLVATDTWQVSTQQQFIFSGFFRTYGLQLRSNFGNGLIQQSESRTVAGGEAAYLLKPHRIFEVLAGVDLRRDAPRGLDLDRADQNGVFQPVTSNDLTLGFVEPFISVDGTVTRYFHLSLGVRREEVTLNNVDYINSANSFDKLAGITLPKGTMTLLPPESKFLPIVAFSIGEAFHTNDPRIGNGTGMPTVIASSHAMQLMLSKSFAHTNFSVNLRRVSNAEELAKIDPDTGLQEDVGPSLTRSITIAGRHSFSRGFLQASWARATATDRITGAAIPEAPRLIWDVDGGWNRLPLGTQARGEYEDVGRKPLGDGFTTGAERKFRGALLRPFRDGQMDLGLNFLITTGYTGQTLETLQLPGEPAPFERIVGVPLKSYVSLSWTYNFRRP